MNSPIRRQVDKHSIIPSFVPHTSERYKHMTLYVVALCVRIRNTFFDSTATVFRGVALTIPFAIDSHSSQSIYGVIPLKWVGYNPFSTSSLDRVGKFIRDDDYLIVSFLIDVPFLVDYNFYCGEADVGKVVINDV
jgi:hypothetical protein